jgi:zinc protease
MNQEPSGRLYKRLVETKLATGAGSSLMGLHDPGWFPLVLSYQRTEICKAAKTALLNVAEGIAAEPITEAELNRCERRR